MVKNSEKVQKFSWEFFFTLNYIVHKKMVYLLYVCKKNGFWQSGFKENICLTLIFTKTVKHLKS